MGRMEALTDSEIKAIERLALNIRRTIIQMLVAAGSGHTAGPLGMADITIGDIWTTLDLARIRMMSLGGRQGAEGSIWAVC